MMAVASVGGENSAFVVRPQEVTLRFQVVVMNPMVSY